MSYLTEEQPRCNFCRLTEVLHRYRGEDVVLVHHDPQQVVVFINAVEVRRFDDMPTECLCGQHV